MKRSVVAPNDSNTGMFPRCVPGAESGQSAAGRGTVLHVGDVVAARML